MKIIEDVESTVNHERSGANIVILSAACCIPSMAGFDKQAEQIVGKAITETGIEAEVKIVPVTTAIFGGGVPKKVMGELMAMFNQGKIAAPAVLINGEVISYGIPTPEIMKEALSQLKEKNQNE